MEKGGFSEMVLIRRALEADFIFTADEYTDELRVLRFNNVEGISEPFRYNLKLAAQDPEIDYGTIVGKSACLTVYGETGERYFNGIVTRLIQGAIGSRFTVYHAELMPKIWLLTMRHGCRIFQNKTVQEIITQIFQDAEIESDRYRFALQGTHNSREYCVQYRESEFNFMSRLMEEEGIFYFFEHDEDKHVMVIADSSAIHTPIESPDIVFNEPSNMVQDKESIFQYRFYRQARPGSTSLRDFNYERPTMGLDVMALSGAGDESFEIYDYPGLYQDQGTGADIAQMRLESLRSNLEVGSGQSVCRRFMPGYRFRMTRHARTSFNQEYLITRLTSSGSQPLGEDSAGGEGLQYSNDFECIPFSVPYRPLRKTPKPIVEGVQTAIVVGPSGDDIYFDDLGRVKVQFHWDRENQNDENSSCWIRSSDGYAGQNHGIQFTPLIGDEVIVDFLEGDPDRPIIIGRVYNGDNIPHLEPQNKVQNQILTPYQHKLLFDDKGASIILKTGGNETIQMTDGGSTGDGSNIKISTADGHYIKLRGGEGQDIFIKTSGDNSMLLTDSQHGIKITTAADHFIQINDSDNTISMQSANRHVIGIMDDPQKLGLYDSGGNLTIEIDVPANKIYIVNSAGDTKISAAGTVNIGAGEIVLTAGNIKINSDGNIEIKAGANISVEAGAELAMSGVTISSSSQGTNDVTGAVVNVEGSGIVSIKGGMVKIN
jgi:type VI secretion system secreted protein VgrG